MWINYINCTDQSNFLSKFSCFLNVFNISSLRVEIQLTACMMYVYKGKGKVHPCTGTEALYRLYSL
jgi:hypothetical protein